MNKQNYHKPQFTTYGDINLMTQAMGANSKNSDGAKGSADKTS